jgi:CTP:molybdopterin cytidylyltransferase MocA
VPDPGYRALIDLNGRPIVSYVMEALSATRGLNRIAVAGSEAVQECVRAIQPDVIAVPDTGKMTGNTLAGMRALGEATGSDERVLITTCDIPLIKSSTFEELLDGFEQRNLEAAYSIVRREVCQGAFPTGKRTYARLADGTFTAGNAVIIERHAVEPLIGLFEKFYQARKNPLAMARMLGASFLWKAATRRLTVAEGEATFSKLLGCRAGTVSMQDATIAFDVDKMDDYEVALKALQQR